MCTTTTMYGGVTQGNGSLEALSRLVVIMKYLFTRTIILRRNVTF